MFAALELVDAGQKPLIFERGRRIEDRHLDVQRFIEERQLDPQSNIQFGEGGAGSYSDGKLFSRKENTECVQKVLNTLIKFGAPPEIATIKKPHLGTDVLCRIVRNIREYVLERGGDIHYSSQMTDLLVSEETATGVVVNGQTEYHTDAIYLAIGHSARDTFEMIRSKGIAVEQKPISVGVRIEHPVEIINELRRGNQKGKVCGEKAANYSFTFTNKGSGRGVYTFCMCPGGEVVNASSEQGLLVVNGMSYSSHSSAFSNSALVVSCRTDDYLSADPLAGIDFQRQIEEKAFKISEGTWSVPAQNLLDFLTGNISKDLNKHSFKMGAVSADLKTILPQFVCDSLVQAFNRWREEYPLFVSEHAILLGAETRTTSPVRIKRNDNFESVNTKNLYPIGEGSGYTGGITSSAADAVKALSLNGPLAP